MDIAHDGHLFCLIRRSTSLFELCVVSFRDVFALDDGCGQKSLEDVCSLRVDLPLNLAPRAAVYVQDMTICVPTWMATSSLPIRVLVAFKNSSGARGVCAIIVHLIFLEVHANGGSCPRLRLMAQETSASSRNVQPLHGISSEIDRRNGASQAGRMLLSLYQPAQVRGPGAEDTVLVPLSLSNLWGAVSEAAAESGTADARRLRGTALRQDVVGHVERYSGAVWFILEGRFVIEYYD